ncbi:hypothetical protein D3Z58_06365 [Clostridiaceae bacterium]|nr:hypothetical protein [Clostridiaceae bacterium]
MAPRPVADILREMEPGVWAGAVGRAAKRGVLDVDVRRLTAMPSAVKIRCLGQCPLVHGG